MPANISCLLANVRMILLRAEIRRLNKVPKSAFIPAWAHWQTLGASPDSTIAESSTWILKYTESSEPLQIRKGKEFVLQRSISLLIVESLCSQCRLHDTTLSMLFKSFQPSNLQCGSVMVTFTYFTWSSTGQLYIGQASWFPALDDPRPTWCREANHRTCQSGNLWQSLPN